MKDELSVNAMHTTPPYKAFRVLGGRHLGRIQQDANTAVDDAVEQVLPAPAKGLERVRRPLHSPGERTAV